MAWGGAHRRLALLLPLVLLASVSALPLSGPVRANASHSTIYIASDAGFNATNGVVSGSGTPGDPYVISGWDIEGPTDPAISIQGTRAAFVIRNLTTIRGGYYEGYRGGGIRLHDVQNGRIENVTLEGTSVGVAVDVSAHVVLSGVRFKDGTGGVNLWDSTDLTVQSIQTSAGWPNGLSVAVSLRNITTARVADSHVVSSGLYGIAVSGSSDVVVENNVVSQSGTGVFAQYQDGGLIIRNNDLTENEGGDIVLEGSTNITIQGNRLASDHSTETGFAVRGDFRANYDSHNISADNLVAGLPLVVAERCSGLDLNGTVAGQIYIAGCTDVQVTNVTLAVRGNGLSLTFVDRALVRNCTFRGGYFLLRYTTNTSSFHNNFIHGAPSDQIGANNTWDDGYPSGGNYYSNYFGPDSDHDGIGDEAWSIYESDLDRYPLMMPYGIPAESPVVNFTLSTASTPIREPFVFDGAGTYDPDGSIITGEWTFGDGFAYAFPGITAGSYAYENPGTYTITLTVTDNSRLTASSSQTIVVTPYVPPAPPLPSIGSPRIVWHAPDFRIPVPNDWSVQHDANLGGQTFDLVAIGPDYNSFRTNLIVVSESDDSIRESHAYLEELVRGAIAGVQSDEPTAFLDGSAVYRTVSNHSAVSFVLRHPTSGVVQHIAVVVSEPHHRLWALALSFDQGLSGPLAPWFEIILAGFEITAAVPTSPFLIVALIGGVVATAAVVAVFAIRSYTKKRSQATPKPYPQWVPPAAPVLAMSGARYCPRCGTPAGRVPNFCGNCGFDLRNAFMDPGLPGPETPSDGKPPST